MHEHVRMHTPGKSMERLEPDHWEELLLDLMRTASVTGDERHVALSLESHVRRNFPDARYRRPSVHGSAEDPLYS